MVLFLTMASVLILAVFFVCISILYPLWPRDFSIKEICSNPKAFNNLHVRLHGYITYYQGLTFGAPFVLRDPKFEGGQIALSANASVLSPYVSFVQTDTLGREITQIASIKVRVTGYMHYTESQILDAPNLYLEVEKVEPDNI
jgi:hypothetical protein